MRMTRISVDKWGINIKVFGFDAVSPFHHVVLYVVEGKGSVCGVWSIGSWLE